MSNLSTPAFSFTVCLEFLSSLNCLGDIFSIITHYSAHLSSLSSVSSRSSYLCYELVIQTNSALQERTILSEISNISGVTILKSTDDTFSCHYKGKLSISSRYPLRDSSDLSRLYTPGVARICRSLSLDESLSFSLTQKHNMVAVISDGSAVLGLGNLGAIPALPVMEGKAILFKEFADVDAFPLVLSTQDSEEIIRTIEHIAPSFGGINLEDISAPRCFYIEEQLRSRLNIPVFHDDQHGTAIVLLAALTNSLRLVNKEISKVKIVIAGTGAAGTACTKLLLQAGAKHIIGVDEYGAVSLGRSLHMTADRISYAHLTHNHSTVGSLSDVISGADVFIGLACGNILSVSDLQKMSKDSIVFAMSNPDPEISPSLALPYAGILATGRSDYPNQINNVLAFPGIFRGALDVRATEINDSMKLAAASAISDLALRDGLSRDYIIPSAFNPEVAKVVAESVRLSAHSSGVTNSISLVPGIDFFGDL